MRRRILKSKINLGLLISFASLFVVFLLITWFSIRLVSSAKSQIESDLQIEMANLERSLNDVIDHTFSIAQSINLQIAENPTNKKHINEILRTYKTQPNLTSTFSWTLFSWSNENYQIIVDSKYGIMEKPFDLSIRDYIPITEKEPEKFHLGAPVIGSTSNKWMIPAGVGIVDKEGNYLGAISIGFEIEALSKLLHKIVQNPNVKFSLFGKNEVPILYGDAESFGVDKSGDDDATNNLKISKVLDEINSGKTDKFFDISLTKNSHAFLAKKVANHPYILFLKYDPKGIDNTLLSLAIARSAELLSMLFALIILLILIYREKKQGQKILGLTQAAESAQEAKAEFLTQSVSEFKNFVFGIHGSAEIIKGDLKDLISNSKSSKNHHNEEQIKTLETDFDLSCNIIEASHELTDFINDLTYLNYAETGEFKINKSKRAVNVANIIKDSIKTLKKRAKNYDMILIAKIDEDLHSIAELDSQRVQQIMINLISGAIKRSQKGGVIEVIARNIDKLEAIKKFDKTTKPTKEKFIEIIIKDHGSSISASDMKAASQKYQAIANITQNKIDALGVGLPIAKYLVEKQDGVFEIKSEKNKGSEIKIIF